MYINQTRGEIHLKLVYYGPALSGKTTNLQYIHAFTNPEMRGDLVSVMTREDRTIYFDFLQLELGKINGLTPKFSLYTVPGQVYYASTRELVLRGADGVVFVADSKAARLRENLDTLRVMRQYLENAGLDPEASLLAVQLNKQDLADAAPIELLNPYLGLNGLVPTFSAVAIRGIGVFDTLKAALHGVIRRIQEGAAVR